MTPGVRFFISYLRSDDASRSFAAALKYNLERRGHTVFVDFTLQAGAIWDAAVRSLAPGAAAPTVEHGTCKARRLL